MMTCLVNKERHAYLQVLVLEDERNKAVADAQEACSEIADLQQRCNRSEMQNRLLQKLLDVQQKHNRSKVDSIQRFLNSNSYPGDGCLSEYSVSTDSSSANEGSAEGDSSAELRMQDLLRAFRVIEQQRSTTAMPPSLLPYAGLERQKTKRHASHRKSHK